MIDSKEEIKAWHEVKIGKRFLNAFRGVHVFAMTSRHLFIIKFATLVVIILGFYLKVSNLEWIALIFSI